MNQQDFNQFMMEFIGSVEADLEKHDFNGYRPPFVSLLKAMRERAEADERYYNPNSPIGA